MKLSIRKKGLTGWGFKLAAAGALTLGSAANAYEPAFCMICEPMDENAGGTCWTSSHITENGEVLVCHFEPDPNFPGPGTGCRDEVVPCS